MFNLARLETPMKKCVEDINTELGKVIRKATEGMDQHPKIRLLN